MTCTCSSHNRARPRRSGRSRAPRTMTIENVTYHRYNIRFRWTDGRVSELVRYAPAEMYMREAIVREFATKDITPDLIMPGSLTIRLAKRK